MSCNIHPYIQEWIDIVEKKIYAVCEEQELLVAHVKWCFEHEDIYIDCDQLEKYIGMSKYFPFEEIFPWQKFVIGLHDCTYWRESGLPRWPDLFCMLGRGAGKDGTIALESVCLMSPHNGIREYDVDICANNEDQAMRPVHDVINAFERPSVIKKLKKFFRWTKEQVLCLKTKSIMKGRTNSPKGKDGLRSGICIFNEIHQYEDYKNINVFTTGLGKKKHPRRSYYTTNGDVREGPLDDLLETSEQILRGGEPDNGLLPFICKLNKKEDVDQEENWPMANPSLPYLPSLMEEIRKEYREWKKNPRRLPAFMTKRMNIPENAEEMSVTEWDNIKALALDDFRFALIGKYLQEIGFDMKVNKNLKLIRPSDIMKVAPLIDSCFVNKWLRWGDAPELRWATNNAKLIRHGRKPGKEDDADMGNYVYGKIEGKSRKTDPFMAFVAAMTVENVLPQKRAKPTPKIQVYNY